MNEKERWIIDNVPAWGTDILNSDFVQSFLNAFSPPFRETNWGARKCPSLGRLLSRMYKKGILTRGIIGLGLNWQPGFPRWVYVYQVSKAYLGLTR